MSIKSLEKIISVITGMAILCSVAVINVSAATEGAVKWNYREDFQKYTEGQSADSIFVSYNKEVKISGDEGYVPFNTVITLDTVPAGGWKIEFDLTTETNPEDSWFDVVGHGSSYTKSILAISENVYTVSFSGVGFSDVQELTVSNSCTDGAAQIDNIRIYIDGKNLQPEPNVVIDDFYAFETDSTNISLGTEDISIVGGKISEGAAEKYLTFSTPNKFYLWFSKMPEKKIIIEAEAEASETGNINMRSYPCYENNRIFSGTNSVLSWNGCKASTYKTFFNARNTLRYVVTKEQIEKDMKSSSFEYSVANALAIDFVRTKMYSLKVWVDGGKSTSSQNDVYGIMDMKFEGVSLNSENNNFGIVPGGLKNISVLFDYPIMERFTEDVIELREDGNRITPDSCNYNSETGYYDIKYDFKKGSEYTVKTAETLTIENGPKFNNDLFTFELSNTEGGYLFTDLTYSYNDNTKASVNFENNCFKVGTATMLLFVYNKSGDMVDCTVGETEQFTPMDKGVLSATIDTDYSSEDYTVKAYVWDNVYSAIPIMTTEE